MWRNSLLVLSLVATLGCAAREDWYTYNLRECERTAIVHGLDQSLHKEFMRQCSALSPDGGVPIMPLMASPNYLLDENPGMASGPYGPIGPSWQQFNSLFQQPHQQPRDRY